MIEPESPDSVQGAAAPASPPRRSGFLAEAFEPFRVPYFGLLWSSNLVQFVCFQVTALSMQWLVTSLTDSRTAIAFVGFLQGAVMALTAPGAGVLVDRAAKRNLIAGGRVGIAIVALIVGALVWTDSIAYWHLLVAGVVGGLLATTLNPATQTYLFDVVGRGNVERAVALNAMGSSLGNMGGPALAGVLIASFGLVATFAGGGFLLLAAALMVLAIPLRGASKPHEAGAFLRDLYEGFAYVRARPALILALVACGMAIFNGAIQPMRPVFARHVLGVGAQGFGMLSAAGGAGTLVAAGILTLWPPRRHLGVWIAGTMFAFALSIVAYSQAPTLEWAMAAEICLGISGQMWNVTAITGIQLAVPEAMRGRILSLVFMLAQLGFIGMLGVGALADWIGDRNALLTFGLIPSTALFFLLLFGSRTLKQM